MSGQGKTFFREKKYIVYLIVGLCLLVGFFWLLLHGEKIGQVSSVQPKAPFVLHDYVPEYKKIVALTFDDGPSPTTTPRLLEILRKENVKATFFESGKLARLHPEITRQVIAQGSEVGSHTMYHQNFNKISVAAIRQDINEAEGVFREILGENIRIMRTPYGLVNTNVRVATDTPIILWSVDTLDWKTKNPEMIKAEVRKAVFDGAIILMHDIYETTVDAVPDIIRELRSEGYDFVTVSEMARIRGVTLQSDIGYGKFRP